VRLVGERTGDDGKGYRWRVEVTKLPDQPPAESVALYSVAVEIGWDEGGTPRQVRLESLRAAMVPRPAKAEAE
jgi:hypothetical protein